jgi:hypothetical protein
MRRTGKMRKKLKAAMQLLKETDTENNISIQARTVLKFPS